MLDLIKKRYIHERAIYTWCGIALVAVNPYQEQDIYGDQVIESYHSASHSVYLQLDPHIYAITEDAYSKLERHLKNQSIIVSGESGAGKTVSAKHAMRYLASIASSKQKFRIENRVLASNPIMEAIGNASTVRNDNSSRFGKYIQIFFDRQNRKILGANMRTYLLEKSRVTKQQSGERNFHIFYQLLNYAHKNPQKMAHLNLLNPEDSFRMRSFKFLAGIEPTEQRDDLRRFNDALRVLGVDEKRIDIIYRILSGILHGGNIKFLSVNDEDDAEADPEDSRCTIDTDEFHFKSCCELIGLDPEETRERLTTKLLRTGGKEVITQLLNKRTAEYGRDAMLKYIYECLFTWLVSLINRSLDNPNNQQAASHHDPVALLKSPSSKKTIMDAILQEPQFIGVLDIYGFENFKTNSFEQFCINYANEVLQQQYNQHVFKLEQEEYIREGIDWTFIEYSDNQPVIDIIESRPIGILNLLDEECRMPKGSDKSWCAKLYDQLLNPTPSKQSSADQLQQTNKVFKKPKLNFQSSFGISHYAEEVIYDVDTFLDKNRDTICEEQSELLRKSDLISYIFDDPLLPATYRPKPKTSKSATVGHQFRGSLAELIRILNSTEPHYVRCIKPNDEKKAFEFNEDRAVQQLKACGVYETIRISNNGFPSRWLYRDFAKRYFVLIYGISTLDFNHNQRTTSEQAELDEVDNDEDTIDLQPRVRFMRNFSANDVRPICEAICHVAYKDTIYQHLRSKEEQSYLNQLYERHGNKSNAIYQFGKTKIFFRDGQVGYLERVRNQLLKEYTTTIQRHVRGWLARKLYAKLHEEYLENLRREASLISLQNQVNSLQSELEHVKEEIVERGGEEDSNANEYGELSEKERVDQEIAENDSRMGSVFHLLVDLVYSAMQPLVIGAVLEYEALDSPEPFASLESHGSSGNTLNQSEQPMEELLGELEKFHDLIVKNSVPQDIAIHAFKQLFHLICAQSLNQLLIRRDLCQFNKAMQISFNLSCLVQWCRERYLVHWREIVEQLDPITQATKLLQTRKSSEDIATIEEVCNKLRPSQIIKILNMYTSSYEEQITTDFIHELEEYLNKSRSQSIDSSHFAKL